MPDAKHGSASEVFARLKKIMAREFDLCEDQIQLSSGFEDLDMDSIDAVDLAVAVEEEIGFQFEMDDMSELRVVQDVVDLIVGVRPRPSG